MKPQRYVTGWTFGYLLISSGLELFFLLRHDHLATNIPLSGTLLYPFVNSLLFVGVWLLVGMEFAPFSIYERRYIRKFVAMILFPAVVAFTSLGLHQILEGRIPSGGIPFGVLLAALLLITLFTCIFCTRESPIAQYAQKELEQAQGRLRTSLYIFGSTVVVVATVVSAGSVIDPIGRYVSQTWNDPHLFRASFVIAVCIPCTFLIQPWFVVREIEDQRDKQKNKKSR